VTVTGENAPACRAARGWISAAIDGETSPAEHAVLRAHLDECSACRAWMAYVESVALRGGTAGPEAPPPLSLPFEAPAPDDTSVVAHGHVTAVRPARPARAPLVAVSVALLAVFIWAPRVSDESRRPVRPAATLAYNVAVANISDVPVTRPPIKIRPVDG
jgi:anti-sigma factor RsiW